MVNDFFILMKSELLLTAIIFLLLFIKIGKGISNDTQLVIIQFLLLGNLTAGFFFNRTGVLFDGMFYTNGLIVFQKSILSLGLYLISLMFSNWFRKHEHMPEFFILMLSAVLGMFFLISSGNFLMFFLGLELATIPVAAMVNFDLHKKISSEGSMKMIFSSAFSSGFLLFGISLAYGATGTLDFSLLPLLIDGGPLQIMILVFLFTAFAFKLSIVPFHLWTADVYEGGPFAASAFLSVLSKASIAFVLMEFLYKVFAPMQDVWYNLVMVLSVATMIVGNLFALRQQNLKRFLAFSSIAQVGFILVGITGDPAEGTSSVVYFILIYTFSNLAVFGIAGLIDSKTGKENIDDYKGLYQTNPFLSWVLALALFSLAGIPPTAGFFGKLFLITSGASNGNYLFITIAALNMIISLYYYLKIIRAVFMDKNDDPIQPLTVNRSEKLAFSICGAAIIFIGFFSWIYEYIQSLYA